MDQAYTNAANPKRLSSLLHLGHACWIGDGWKTFDLAYSTRDKWIFSSQFTRLMRLEVLEGFGAHVFTRISRHLMTIFKLLSLLWNEMLVLQVTFPFYHHSWIGAGPWWPCTSFFNRSWDAGCWRFWDWSSNRFVPTCTRGTRRHWEKSQFTIQFLHVPTRVY